MRMKPLAVPLIIVAALACSREETPENTATAAPRASTATDRITVPAGPPAADPTARERERFDEAWRKLTSFQRQEQRRARRDSAPVSNIQFVRNGKESFEGMNAERINAAPVIIPIRGDVSGPSVLKTQVYLDRLNFSPGVIDGRWGKNTAIALWWYQRERGLEETGEVDEETFRSLVTDASSQPAVVSHNVTSQDVEGPFVKLPDDVYEQAKLDCLCYESPLEKLAEQFHTTPEFLETLNPGTSFGSLSAGATIIVPNVARASGNPQPVSRIVVSLRGNTFNAYDEAGNLVFHAPTTVGSEYDPSPTETLKITAIARDPHFHYQPKLFHEVPDDEPETTLEPGPNSPVGVVWMQLSKPHYGIHGTSDPASIGYASSHGCIRLTNWDARAIADRASEGVVVEFVDTRRATTAAE